MYLSLSCEQFVGKFLPLLKVEREAIPLYPSHVAIVACMPLISVPIYAAQIL